MSKMPSDLIESAPEAVKSDKPKGCLVTLLYLVLFLFLIPIALGTGGVASEFVPAWLMWLLFLVVVSVPFLIRYQFQQRWKRRNLFAFFLLLYAVVMGVTQSFFTNTEAYQEYQSRTASQSTQDTLPQEETPESNSTDYPIGESFKVGYTEYLVKGIEWRKSIGDTHFGGQTANARYLLVTIQVKNLDRESRMIPPFYLVDENGAKYESSPEGVSDLELMKKNLLLSSLNPGVQKTGIVLFDVPPEHQYKLLVSGGFWNNDEVTVPLD